MKSLSLLDSQKLVGMISCGAKLIGAHKAYLNQINYFPVPDADTGTNLHQTILQLSNNSSAFVFPSIAVTTRAIAESVLLSARGNSGAILAQFFQGFADSLRECHTPLTLKQFASAAYHASDKARKAVLKPVEGTILTVMRDWSSFLQDKLADRQDFIVHLKESQKIAEKSLANTVWQLRVASKQVDAGAQGFVYFVQGFVEYLTKGHISKRIETLPQDLVTEADIHDFHTVTFQYCTEVLVTGQNMSISDLENQLSPLGDSLIVIGGPESIKIHIHTNVPAQVFAIARRKGQISQEKIEDMFQQMRDIAIPRPERKICFVIDTSCNLDPTYIRDHNIHILPLRIQLGEDLHYDSVTLTPEEFYEQMKSNSVVPHTSQVTLVDAERLFQWTSQTYDHTIALMIAGVDSGTLQSVSNAAKTVAPARITVIDSKSGSGAIGLMAMRAIDLIEQGADLSTIRSGIEKAVQSTQLLVTVEDLTYLYRGGRLTKTKFIVANLLGLKPIIRVSKEGKLYQAGSVLGGKNAAQRKLIQLICKETNPQESYRFIVSHTLDLTVANWYKQEIQTRFPTSSVYLAPLSPTIGTHGGPGTITIAWIPQAE